MREDYGNISLVTHDEGFGDMGFGAPPPDLMREHSSLDTSIHQVSFTLYLTLNFGWGSNEQKSENKIKNFSVIIHLQNFLYFFSFFQIAC